ncbi:MAG: HNH endonuclease [Sphingomicrobium sp.]
MSGPENLSKVDRLRARDGDFCWLCNKPIDFNAQPNSANAWSMEHLISASRQGPSTLENLVLCHPRCNRVLGDRALADKIRLRERRRRKLWIATLSSQ